MAAAGAISARSASRPWALDDRRGETAPLRAAVALAIIVPGVGAARAPGRRVRGCAPTGRGCACRRAARSSRLPAWPPASAGSSSTRRTRPASRCSSACSQGCISLPARSCSRPAPRRGRAVFVWAVRAALRRGRCRRAARRCGAARFWAVETLATLCLFVRFGDRQAGSLRGLLATLTVAGRSHLAPPDSLAIPLATLRPVPSALGALVARAGGRRLPAAPRARCRARSHGRGLGRTRYLVPARDRRPLVPWPGSWSTRPPSCSSRAWAALAPQPPASRPRTALPVPAAPSRPLSPRSACGSCLKALGARRASRSAPTSPRLLWLPRAMAVLAAVLVAVDHRPPRRGSLSLPLAARSGGSLLVAGLCSPVRRLSRGDPRTCSRPPRCSISASSRPPGALALPVEGARRALVAAVLLAAGALLTTVTLLTPRSARPRSVHSALSPSSAPLGLALLASRCSRRAFRRRCARRPRVHGRPARARRRPAVVDTAEFGATGLESSSPDSGWVRRAGSRSPCAAQPGSGCSWSRRAAPSPCACSRSSRPRRRAARVRAEHGWLGLGGRRSRRRRAGRRAVRSRSLAHWRGCTALARRALRRAPCSSSRRSPQSGTHVDQAAQLALSIAGRCGARAARRRRRPPLAARAFPATQRHRPHGRRRGQGAARRHGPLRHAHRAAVFLALGLILLAGACAYARLTRKLDARAADVAAVS